MEYSKTFIESGILEAYVLGSSTMEENDLVEQMAAAFSEIRDEIAVIGDALELYALSNIIVPEPTLKPMLLASVDFTERMKNGELPSYPPELHDSSKISDYNEWLNRPDMISGDFNDLHAKIIGYTPQAVTAIVWIKDMAPQEVHDDEYEKFLIVEGTCDITIGDNVYQLQPGDYLAIPLYEKHFVQVTSLTPCKVILQRIAA